MVAAALAVGFSTLLAGAAPANAAVACSDGGKLLAGGVCELAFTTPGSATFNVDQSMSQLEVLLVGGGGAGSAYNGNGGGYGGGGGDVKLVGFDSSVSALDIEVGAADGGSSVSRDNDTYVADPGVGGKSGSGMSAWLDNFDFAAGGGAGASPTSAFDGGAGIVVSTLAKQGSPFIDDENCYGGGGAVSSELTQGFSTCGGGSATQGDPDGDVVAAAPNSGGGGGGGQVSAEDTFTGASGVVVVRWKVALPVTATFNINEHGVGIDPQGLVAGGSVTRPADPTAAGFTFAGWYTDSALTLAADFSVPISVDTTYYAAWNAVPATATSPATATLAATGISLNSAEVPLGAAALALGLGLMAVTAKRLRSTTRTPR
jgi:uncharacterized repeat protein (TIGR02543 family)